MSDEALRRIGFSDLVLTAANRGQARATLRTIRGDPTLRQELPSTSDGRLLVVPDPGGRRVGSGVATLMALRAVVERERRRVGGDRRLHADADAIAALLRGRTLAIVHSGGDSRRLPAYAAEGKIFVPMPDRHAVSKPPIRLEVPTLLERIVGDLDSIESPSSGGVIVASGDVWLDVASQAIRFDGESIECVAFAAAPERGSRHGVFAPGPSGEAERFLQKPSLRSMQEHGCLERDGRVLVDTGLVFIPWTMAAEWVAAASRCGVLGADAPLIDLYADLLPATALRWNDRPDRDPRAAALLERVRELAAASPLRVKRLERCAFRHAGSTRELLVEATSLGGDGTIGGSFRRWEMLSGSSSVGAGSFVDRCGDATATLGASSMLVGIPFDPGMRVEVPSDRGLLVVPVRGDSFAAIAFGIDDDFKTGRDSGGTVLGMPLSRLVERCWSPDDRDRTLWTARIWPVGDLAEILDRASDLLADPSRATPEADSWSAAEIFAAVDHRRLSEARRSARCDWLRRRFESAEFGASAARLAHALSGCAIDSDVRESWRRRAFALVSQMVAESSAAGAPAVGRSAGSRRFPATSVVMRAPARIDLAGGWTDTPPICFERGGAVVNVAIDVDGEAPLEVVVRRIEAPIVRIESSDLGRSTEFSQAQSLFRAGDPRDASDWALLPRTAIAVSGILGDAEPRELGDALDPLGGGFELRIASRLPKGSGLGTSSILGALTLASLARFGGRTFDRASLIAQTSALEQRMGTAGGWQDQAGGITAGAKLLETAPGLDQVPTETPLAIPERFWRDRVLVHSTGLQRLARNILQQVVWRWLGGGHRVQRIIDRIHATAIELRSAIDREDEAAIAGLIGEGWRLKCELDPGSTTPEIEAMVDPIRAELAAWSLPGAGGGGFLFLVARSRDAADRIRDRFTKCPPHAGGRFHDIAIAEHGIREASEVR